MSEFWTDRDEARRVMAPERTPDRITLDARTPEQRIEGDLAEQAARIDGLETQLQEQNEALRELRVQVNRLAPARSTGSARPEIAALQSVFGHAVNDLQEQLDEFKERVIEAMPSVGKPTIQEQCDESWKPTPEEAVKAMGLSSVEPYDPEAPKTPLITPSGLEELKTAMRKSPQEEEHNDE